MRRSLDPEGYEDPGLKSSHVSLGEMSSEWLLGCWGAPAAWASGWHCRATSVTGVPAPHGRGRARVPVVTRAPLWQR